ncbi:SDR family NAD(P)-dependent oxidoreductase [Arvimicrobium flavum]|uniref:SDR family NAD(P)-dependent oxidoreductase n=1 Tax=Arvimicrobium flavum TaxID=3393320 RepID=UPI00237BC50B|nr:SDR family NAD(P)-dependent oxidoreductase [Mesorhizobium shangrilense]
MTNLGLAGRVVLVTGAASGIGRAVAQCFAEAGSRVALADINAAGVREAASALSPDALPLSLDLGNEADCNAAVAQTVARFGRLDVLVNAGAIIMRQPLDAVSPDDIQRTAMVNMAGPLFIARAAAAAMKANGFGRIVLFSSQGAHTGGYVGSTVYAMSKAGVLALTKSLAREFARDGITVNAVAPGLVDTPMIRNDVSEEALARFMDMIPMGRVAAPEELARCCMFLASDWSSYVTGHTLDVNGGQLMR